MFLKSLCTSLVVTFLAFALSAADAGSNLGKRYPSEMRMLTDSVTGQKIKALTTSSANDSKPYQTHTTWTSDGKWIIFRSDRAGPGTSQAFVVNEETGDIIQVTDDPTINTGSLNLSRKEMKLWAMRGGPKPMSRDASSETKTTPPPAPPRQLVEINLGALINDSLAGKVKAPDFYQRVVVTLPADLRDSGGFAIDADETKAYWGVGPANIPPIAASAAPAAAAVPPAAAGAAKSEFEKAQQGNRGALDSKNTDPTEAREAARARFAAAGKGPGGIRSIDLKTGEIKTVIDVDFRMGHVQANPWVPGEIVYCHETGGDAPQRTWIVKADGSENRPLYLESPDEWITHETFSGKDEVMFLIIGHLPYLREKPTGIAVINPRNRQMKILGQIEEEMGRGQQGGYWHCNGSPDGRWAAGDTFKGSVYLIDRKTGENILLTTGHMMKPDHAHPIFSDDSKRVAIQSGLLSQGKNLNLMVIDVPAPKAAK